ncbi:FkbM family methyltransferase [Luteibacter aegosomaticola]|uniref:FkbM family methyltransferase n=1 Tax=Luteibacter aegosomaticola TaxID=2911538 RepID=UPI001FF7FF80|nr:FkbM family methyltransferase [Luteibacter aegosomaticola]UPG91111.1 FkbM family methyltransferase [Luteibacter aegosomaticola]
MRGDAMEADVNIAGRQFTLTSDDAYLGALGATFEPEMVRLFECFAKGTVLDIGANIGCTALAFSGMADIVHAFEPSPSTFELLATNTSVVGNVQRHNYGLGDAAGAFELTFAPTNRSGGFVSNQTQASAGHTVEKIEIRTLDDVAPSLVGSNIDFIKIDVEGFEGSVIRGGERTLAAARPVVALELNHWCLNAFQRTSVPDFFDYLRAVFPTLYAVEGSTYLNLHDPNESYAVMYQHILHMRYVTLVGSFDTAALAAFHARYEHRLAA